MGIYLINNWYVSVSVVIFISWENILNNRVTYRLHWLSIVSQRYLEINLYILIFVLS